MNPQRKHACVIRFKCGCTAMQSFEVRPSFARFMGYWFGVFITRDALTQQAALVRCPYHRNQ